MALPAKKVIKATLPVTHSRRGEEVVVGYVDSEHILDPNDPRAVEVAVDGLGGGNPLDVLTQPSPNEVAGDQPAQYYNPHTGENTTDGSATEPSPVPDNVPQAESLDDVTDGQTLVTEQSPEEAATEPEIVTVQDPNAPGDSASPDEEPQPEPAPEEPQPEPAPEEPQP